MISTTYSKPKPRALPLPQQKETRPEPGKAPRGQPLEASDVWDQYDIALLIHEGSKLAAAVRFLGLDYHMIGKSWLDVGVITLEEYFWCIAYCRRYTDEKLPPLPSPRQAPTFGKTANAAPGPEQTALPWDDAAETLPLPEMEA